jgi:hypothetical protein
MICEICEAVSDGAAGAHGERRTHAFEVHALHRLVHAAHDGRHVARDLAHRHRGLDAACDRGEPAREPQQVQRLALLANRIRRVDPRAVRIALLQCLRAVSRDAGRERTEARALVRRAFSVPSSFAAFFACRFSVFAVN